MKNKLVLSITMTSLIALGVGIPTVSASDTGGISKPAPKKAHHSGKCASGKCGTDKMFSKKKLTSNPQGKLVYARDGKCGMIGKVQNKGNDDDAVVALSVKPIGKCASGVCGQ